MSYLSAQEHRHGAIWHMHEYRDGSPPVVWNQTAWRQCTAARMSSQHPDDDFSRETTHTKELDPLQKADQIHVKNLIFRRF